MSERKEAVKEFLGVVISLPGVLMITVGVLILVGEIYYHLKLGYWSSVTTLQAMEAAGFSRPVTDWVGVQKMVDGFLGLLFSAVSIIAGTAAYWIAWRIIFGRGD